MNRRSAILSAIGAFFAWATGGIHRPVVAKPANDGITILFNGEVLITGPYKHWEVIQSRSVTGATLFTVTLEPENIEQIIWSNARNRVAKQVVTRRAGENVN